MGSIDSPATCSTSPAEQLAEQFYDWELRGRGWLLLDRAVEPEPPFKPFFCHSISESKYSDDGQKHTLLSGAIDWLHHKLVGGRNGTAIETDNDHFEESPAKEYESPGELVELQVSIPSDLEVTRESAEQFLLCACGAATPLAFEIIGTADAVTVQFVCDAQSANHIEQQLKANFPEVTITTHSSFLEEAWHTVSDPETVVAEFGLAREFMLPLATSRSFAVDPLAGIVAALANVAAGEIAFVQVLFQAVRHPWAESVLRSITFSDGSPFFDGLASCLEETNMRAKCKR